VVVHSRRAPTAAQDTFMANVAELLAARFEQSRRLASPSTLAAAQAITSERRRVAETLQAISRRRSSRCWPRCARGATPRRAREAERVASEALVELRGAAQFEADLAESTAASLLDCVQQELGRYGRAGRRATGVSLGGRRRAVVPEAVAQAAAYITEMRS
jgi:hypothetical protein